MFPISGAKLTIRCLSHDLFFFTFKKVDEIVKFNNDRWADLWKQISVLWEHKETYNLTNRHAWYWLSYRSNDDGSVVHKLVELRFSKGHKGRCFLGDLRLPSPCKASFQAFSVNAFRIRDERPGEKLSRTTWPETHRPLTMMRPRD